ncbi:helix-turn-helix domain-containing protein [Sungkyunkwania multivorans]|uniref:Helix-turn-helix domain-containing protein n=1 Tax=Sungkyunkwania multivorans TaxID=1173618 RepID=A0ABW3CUV3_9FLAO
MNSMIEIQDDDASNILKDIAHHFDLKREIDNRESCVRIPKQTGSGYIKAYCFDFGISVLESDFILSQHLDLKFKRSQVHPLKILFNRGNSFTYHLTNSTDDITIDRLEGAIIASTPQKNHIFKIPANEPINMFSVEINRKLFEDKIADFILEMNDDLIDLFRDANGVNPFFYKGLYSYEIERLIEDFMDSEHEGFMRWVFLEAKVYEIIVNQLKQYLDDLFEPEKRKILRKATIEKIEKAVEIIEQEIDSMDSVSQLAKRVGLNQNNLQKGFKLLYAVSVKEYIRNYRIEKARQLMETTSLNITEITYKIGINSRSYFSKIFKQKYGVSPKLYKEQIKNNRQVS